MSIDEIQDAPTTIADTIREYLAARDTKDRLAADLRASSNACDILESRVLEAMGLQGLDSLKLDGCTVSRTSRNYSSIKPECKAAAIDALQQMGYGDRVVTLNHQAMSSLLNEWNDQGTMPKALTGMVQIFEKQGLSVRKAR